MALCCKSVRGDNVTRTVLTAGENGSRGPPSSMRKTMVSAGSKLKIFSALELPVSTPVKSKPAFQEVEEGAKWNPLQKLAAAVLDAAEETVVRPLEKRRPLPKTSDPAVQLRGNFAPVPETPVKHDLEVEGRIPGCLDGVYVRNGANPLFEPRGGHHLFDGDGLIHAVTLRHGKASYSCRFTETERLVSEERAGRSFYPKPIGELHGHAGLARLLLHGARGLCGLVNTGKGMGVANAGLAFFNGRLLAMSEDDLPYAVRVTSDGDLETAGRFDFHGQLHGSSSVIAHPSIDPDTGEFFLLSYNVLQRPYLRYFHFHHDGTTFGPPVDINITHPTMVHDFVVTKRHIIVPDQQMIFNILRMFVGGSPVFYDREKIPRFGVMPRDDTDDGRMTWIDVPGCFCFHLWNAWEEPDTNEVVVVGSCMTPADGIFNEYPDKRPLRSILSEIRLNPTTGASTRTEIVPDLNLEAGQINRSYVGRRSRYAYMAIAEPWPRVSGIAKVDLVSREIVAKILFDEGCYGGEPYFVARSPPSAEDDGYVVTFVYNETTGKSEFLIFDARTPGLDVVASVKLPSRVPYGFHGTFITGDELACQHV